MSNDEINAVTLKRGRKKTSQQCRKMREIIRLLKLKITKKTFSVSTIVGTIAGNLKQLASGHLCLLLLHELASQCDPIPMRCVQSILLLSPDLAHR